MLYAILANLLELTLFWVLIQDNVRLDRSISYGNIMSSLAAVAAAIGAFYALKGQVNTMGERLTVQRGELDKKTEDVDKLSVNIGSLQVTMATLNVTVVNLATQFEKFDKRFEVLNTKVDETKEEVLKKNGGRRRH